MTPKELARGHWDRILPACGVDPACLIDKHGPCPVCGGKDRFRFDNKDGEGTWICSQCDAGDGYRLIQNMTGQSFREVLSVVEEFLGEKADAVVPEDRPRQTTDNRDRLRKTLLGCTPMGTSLEDHAARYLVSRGLRPNPYLYSHPALTYYEDGKRVGDYPAMVAKVANAKGEVVTLHITYLDKDAGCKADVASCRKILPPIKDSMTGASVRLGKMQGGKLIIAEGIETALAAMEHKKVAAWAALNANNMQKIELPEEARRIYVVGDNDPHYVGQHAAFALASRLAREGREVRVYVPGKRGHDYLDEMLEKKRA